MGFRAEFPTEEETSRFLAREFPAGFFAFVHSVLVRAEIATEHHSEFEDLVQWCAIRVLGSVHKFKPKDDTPGAFRPWAWKVIVRAASDYSRHYALQGGFRYSRGDFRTYRDDLPRTVTLHAKNGTSRSPAEETEIHDFGDEDPEHERKERVEYVRWLIDTYVTSKNSRKYMRAYYSPDGLPRHAWEIARDEGCSEANVCFHLRQGVRDIQRRLGRN